MAIQIEAYPSYGSDDDKALWLQRVATSINELATTGITGGGTGDGNVEVDADTGRITADDGNIFLGYAYRYLHLRLTSDAAGTTLVDPATFTGSLLYIGVFNSMSPGAPPSDANFVYSSFAWAAGFDVFYHLTTGRNLQFATGSFVPAGNNEVTGQTSIIDLEDILEGDAGANGQSIFPIYATDEMGANQQFAEADTHPFVTFFESLNAPTLPVSGQVFVRAQGEDAIVINVSATNGTVFKSDVSSMKVLTANVSIGGDLQPDNTHASYGYDWQFNGSTVYIDSTTRDLITANGVPVVDGDPVPGNGILATGTGNLVNRTIRVSENDISNGATLYLTVDVSGIQ